MIIEHVYLSIRPNQSSAFEDAFKQAKEVIYPMEGLKAVQLIKKVDDSQHYILLIFWDSIEHHQQDFRQSPAYQVWKSLLHPFYDPMPEVEYYEPCMMLKKKNPL